MRRRDNDLKYERDLAGAGKKDGGQALYDIRDAQFDTILSFRARETVGLGFRDFPR